MEFYLPVFKSRRAAAFKSRGNRALLQYPLLKLLKSQGQESLVTQKVRTMWLIQNQKGQNLIEYAIIVAVVASAMLAMSIYVSRSVQATQQAIQEGYKD